MMDGAPLLAAGIRVWLKLLLLGWAWVWVLPDNLVADPRPARRLLFSGAWLLLLGVLLTALSTLALGEIGIFSPGGEQATRALIGLAGIGGGLWSNAKRTGRILLQAMPLPLLLLPLFVAVLALPHRGEWIVGGWDPGVYLNQAAALSRSGTFYPPDRFFHDALNETERRAFLRSGHGRTERFPGILHHPEHGGFSFEFFRLTPAVYAAIHRSGSLEALTRANTFLALLLLPVFLALLWRHLGPPTAVLALALLATQPIWLFHAHFPTTEMLQLLLLCGLLFAALERPARPQTGLAAVLFAAAAVFNRFSFLPFAGLFLICQALGDATDPNRRSVWTRHLSLAGAFVVAAVINTRIAPASIAGWSILPVLIGVSLFAILLALVLDGLFASSRFRRRASSLVAAQWDVVGGSLLLLLALSWLLRSRIGTSADADNLLRLVPFVGRLPLLLGGAGLIALLFWRPRLNPRVLFSLCLFLLGIGWLMLLRKSITDWYPWATRRYLPYLVPFLAVAGGHLAGRMWQRPRYKSAWRLAALMLLAAAVIETAPAGRRAWRYTSYNGMIDVIDDIAGQIDPDDVVIVDHPWWGTPLALIHGRNVLNGREIWMEPDGDRLPAMLSTIERLANEERRVRFLTSTDKGIALYPVETDAFVQDWSSPAIAYQSIIQHPRATRFELQTREVRFRLYTFDPDGTDAVKESQRLVPDRSF